MSYVYTFIAEKVYNLRQSKKLCEKGRPHSGAKYYPYTRTVHDYNNTLV